MSKQAKKRPKPAERRKAKPRRRTIDVMAEIMRWIRENAKRRKGAK